MSRGTRLLPAGRPSSGLIVVVPVVVVVRVVICGGPALTGRIGRHSTAGLAVVAAANLVVAQLEEGVGRSHPKLVTRLRERGHETLAASPASGVNTLTGQGLAAALENASVVTDVSNAPSFEDAAVLEFFETSTRNLLAAESAAGVGHHVALSVVGTERLPDSGYFRAKIAQEKLIEDSPIPYSIVHATQFFEFINRIADTATNGNTVRLAHVLIQPMAAEDVATAVADVTVGPPVDGIIEVAGPQQFHLDELIRNTLRERHDPREVITDPHAPYYGAELHERTLVPAADARLTETSFDHWLNQSTIGNS